jgi:hypothetical protein
MDFSRRVSPVSLLGVSSGYVQRVVVGESGMRETEYVSNGRSVWDALCDTTP